MAEVVAQYVGELEAVEEDLGCLEVREYTIVLDELILEFDH